MGMEVLMLADQQVNRLFKLIQSEKNFKIAAMKAGMDEKTARKYRRKGKLPSELKKAHTWRTRKDPFADVWPTIHRRLEADPALEAKSTFQELKLQFPGRFSNGQLRTLQRMFANWRKKNKYFGSP